VAEESGGGNRLREYDSDRDEDGSGAGSKGDGDFDAGSFGIFIAAAECDAPFGKIFTNGNFFLKAAAADAGEHAGFDASAIAAWEDAIVFHGV
jgi:hypothetical protein